MAKKTIKFEIDSIVYSTRFKYRFESYITVKFGSYFRRSINYIM